MLSRHVIVDGIDRGLCIVTVDESDKVVDISPFRREEHSVAYVDTDIVVDTNDTDLILRIQKD